GVARGHDAYPHSGGVIRTLDSVASLEVLDPLQRDDEAMERTRIVRSHLLRSLAEVESFESLGLEDFLGFVVGKNTVEVERDSKLTRRIIIQICAHCGPAENNASGMAEGGRRVDVLPAS